jgi:hypothetical protein
MADPSAFDFIRIPSNVLIAMDWRPYRFAMQPYHYIVRIVHIASMAAFYGSIAALDLRLLGMGVRLPLRPTIETLLPVVYVTFGVSIVSGIALFFYDPLHVGSHAYFSVKIILTLLGIANALIFGRAAGAAELTQTTANRSTTVIAGTASLLFWTGVLVCACLNVEGVPKVFLR